MQKSDLEYMLDHLPPYLPTLPSESKGSVRNSIVRTHELVDASAVVEERKASYTKI